MLLLLDGLSLVNRTPHVLLQESSFADTLLRVRSRAQLPGSPRPVTLQYTAT